MTSSIRPINVIARTAETESGRVYDLEAGPVCDAETVEFLMARPALTLLNCHGDVSDEVWLEIVRSSH